MKKTLAEFYQDNNNPRKIPHYLSNMNVKGHKVPETLTTDEVEEFIRCKNSAIHFIENWCKIVVPKKGVTNFKLFDYQKEAIKAFEEDRFNIILAARQMGKSQVVAAFMLWFILFNSNKQCFVLSKDHGSSKDVLKRLSDMFQMVPFFLQPGAKGYAKTYIELSNGSRVESASSSGDSVRGRSIDFIYLDEFAYLDNDVDFYTSTYPAITAIPDSKIIITSTPKGVGNIYYKLWSNSIIGNNEYNPLRWKWHQRPDRGETFKQQTIANMSERQWNQEFECTFLSGASTLIDTNTLETLVHKAPVHSNNEQTVRMYEDVIEGHRYVACVDTSDGVEKDYSTINIIDITVMPFKQVMVFQCNKTSPLSLSDIAYKWATHYNEAFVLVENNSRGFQVAVDMYHNLEYENFYCQGAHKETDIGLTTTSKVKRTGCSKLKDLVESNLLEVIDENTLTELRTFEKKGKSWEAAGNAHDDLVMNLVLFSYLTTQAHIFDHLVDRDKTLQESLKEIKNQQIEDQSIPIGFFRSGTEEEPNDGWFDL